MIGPRNDRSRRRRSRRGRLLRRAGFRRAPAARSARRRPVGGIWSPPGGSADPTGTSAPTVCAAAVAIGIGDFGAFGGDGAARSKGGSEALGRHMSHVPAAMSAMASRTIITVSSDRTVPRRPSSGEPSRSTLVAVATRRSRVPAVLRSRCGESPRKALARMLGDPSWWARKSQPRKYSPKPVPPTNASRMKPIRTATGLTPAKCPTPPATPEMIRSSTLRRKARATP